MQVKGKLGEAGLRRTSYRFVKRKAHDDFVDISVADLEQPGHESDLSKPSSLIGAKGGQVGRTDAKGQRFNAGPLPGLGDQISQQALRQSGTSGAGLQIDSPDLSLVTRARGMGHMQAHHARQLAHLIEAAKDCVAHDPFLEEGKRVSGFDLKGRRKGFGDMFQPLQSKGAEGQRVGRRQGANGKAVVGHGPNYSTSFSMSGLGFVRPRLQNAFKGADLGGLLRSLVDPQAE